MSSDDSSSFASDKRKKFGGVHTAAVGSTSSSNPLTTIPKPVSPMLQKTRETISSTSRAGVGSSRSLRLGSEDSTTGSFGDKSARDKSLVAAYTTNTSNTLTLLKVPRGMKTEDWLRGHADSMSPSGSEDYSRTESTDESGATPTAAPSSGKSNASRSSITGSRLEKLRKMKELQDLKSSKRDLIEGVADTSIEVTVEKEILNGEPSIERTDSFVFDVNRSRSSSAVRQSTSKQIDKLKKLKQMKETKKEAIKSMSKNVIELLLEEIDYEMETLWKYQEVGREWIEKIAHESKQKIISNSSYMPSKPESFSSILAEFKDDTPQELPSSFQRFNPVTIAHDDQQLSDTHVNLLKTASLDKRSQLVSMLEARLMLLQKDCSSPAFATSVISESLIDEWARKM